MNIFELFGKVGLDTKDAESKINGIGEKAKGLGSKLGGMVAGVAKVGAGVSVALGGVAVAASKVAVDFETGMSNVATLLDGDVNTRIKEMGDEVKKLQVSTGLSFDTLQDGLYETVSALGDSAESMKILEVAAKASKAGNAEVKDSIALLSAVTKGYGDTSLEANKKVSDMAFNAVKLGQTTFPELASSMGKVVPIAANLGVQQEELFGVMATLTGVTGSASEVSTQFRGVLQGLMKPTNEMEIALSKLGYESGQALLEQEGLQGALFKLSGIAEQGEVDFNRLFGSVEGLTAAMALTGPQADVWIEKQEAMGKAAGATDAAFETQTNNVQGMMDKLKQLGVVAMTNLGEKFIPIINQALGFLIDKMPEITAALEKTFDVVGDIVVYLVNLFNTYLMPILKQVFDFIIDNLPEIKAFISAVIDTVSTVIKNIIEIFKTIFDYMKGLYESNRETIEEVISLIQEFISTFKEVLIEIFNFIKKFIDENLEAIKASIKLFVDIVIDTFKYFVELLTNLLKLFLAIFRGDWDQALEIIKNLWSNFWEFVENIGEKFSQLIKNTISLFFTFIMDLFKKIFNLDDINTGEIVEKFLSPFFKIMDWFKEKWSGLTDIIKKPFDALGSVGESIAGFAGGVAEKGKGLLSKIPGFKKGTASAPGGAALVGEEGPELVELPKGSRVRTANNTKQLLTKQAPTKTENNINEEFNFSGNHFIVREEADIKKIAKELYEMSRRKNRGLGIV